MKKTYKYLNFCGVEEIILLPLTEWLKLKQLDLNTFHISDSNNIHQVSGICVGDKKFALDEEGLVDDIFDYLESK